MKRTKIVATIGPSCDSVAKLSLMIKAGMNLARFNFSHGTYKSNKRAVKNLRKAAKKLKATIGIIQDLQGPRIRVGQIDKEGLELTKGEIVELIEDVFKKKNKSKNKVIPIQFIKLAKVLKPGGKILLLDGLIELKVTEINSSSVLAKVQKGGIIYSYKGVNIPGANLGLPVITEKDKKDLKFGLKLGVDYVAMSFVGSAKDLIDLKKLIKKYSPKSKVLTMAKIERSEAVKEIKQIVKEADAVMVARGDLGIELPSVKVPVIQKDIIKRCLEEGRPVIVATQMFDSMITNPKPTRAEVSDVANAVIDHTDAVMLSGESAFGKYPVEAVSIMSDVIKETEKSIYDDMSPGYFSEKNLSVTQAVSESVFELVKDTGAKAIVATADSGYTARMITRYRPETKIIILVRHPETARQLTLSWGIYPVVMPVGKSMDELINKSVKLVKLQKLVKTGDQIIIVGNQLGESSKDMDLVKVQTI